ncbi:MAG TPA: nucleotidyltransferase domain-containing protein [Thermomicrobiales bacterium]|nr:nucleotidyltransferase domain-containing protein [Thermomicrobiales bacterium]
MQAGAHYPTIAHARAAAATVVFLSQEPDIAAVMLTGSCARGRATPDSCLDLAVLVQPEVLSTERPALQRRWEDFAGASAEIGALLNAGAYSHVDLDFFDGCFAPRPRGWTSGPDAFELEIGNTLVYTTPLWERSDEVTRLKERWLPYYDERLRRRRLAEVRRYCLNNLDHIPLYVDRGLYFQAFHRLYDAFREFLQALFIARRAYPIAYDKWVREQVEEILGLPELYQRLARIFEIDHFEGPVIAAKARELRLLAEQYATE